MRQQPKLPEFIWQLFKELRHRGFPLTLDDLEVLRESLQAGFGWSSLEALRQLCNSLWAKSRQEQEILTVLFNQSTLKDEAWQLFSVSAQKGSDTGSSNQLEQEKPPQEYKEISVTKSPTGLPPISLKDIEISKRQFIFVPQFPLNYREVAQIWRCLRRPVRQGLPTELDVEATITRRSQLGVAVPVILRPRHRKVARLLLLVDRQGSMTPFHRFCEEVCKAIQQAGRLEETTIYYFHNVPAEGADDHVLEPLSKELFPVIDSILPQITSLNTDFIDTAFIYEDSNLLAPIPLKDVLEKNALNTFVVIISDAGAIRNHYSVPRLLDTISFVKVLRTYTLSYVWLNPLPKPYWKDKNNTATQIARHVPMFALEREGIQQAVNVLRGHQYIIEKPL